MAFVPVPLGVKCEMNYTQNSIPVVNRFYITVPTEPVSDFFVDVQAAIQTFYEALQPFQHPSLILQNVTLTDVTEEDGLQLITPYSTDNTGLSGGGTTAANAAMCVSLRSAFTGRSRRGRFYMGGIAIGNQQDAQNWTASTTAAIAGIFEDFQTALGVLDFALVVASTILNGAQRVVALVTEITSFLVDTKIDSQRRRTAN